MDLRRIRRTRKTGPSTKSHGNRLDALAIARNPRHFDAAHLLGVIHLRQGRPDAAERQIRLAIRINANVAMAHNSLGLLLKELDRLDDAALVSRVSCGVASP